MLLCYGGSLKPPGLDIAYRFVRQTHCKLTSQQRWSTHELVTHFSFICAMVRPHPPLLLRRSIFITLTFLTSLRSPGAHCELSNLSMFRILCSAPQNTRILTTQISILTRVTSELKFMEFLNDSTER